MSAINLDSLDDTHALAQRIAAKLRRGDTVLLGGDLGAGKTTFAQFLVNALSSAPVEVTSPTFNLVQDYPVTLTDGTNAQLYHYDLYRIDKPSAFTELGMDEYENEIRLVEWPSRLPPSFAPQSWISLHFALEGSQRKATLQSGGAAAGRFAA